MRARNFSNRDYCFSSNISRLLNTIHFLIENCCTSFQAQVDNKQHKIEAINVYINISFLQCEKKKIRIIQSKMRSFSVHFSMNYDPVKISCLSSKFFCSDFALTYPNIFLAMFKKLSCNITLKLYSFGAF